AREAQGRHRTASVNDHAPRPDSAQGLSAVDGLCAAAADEMKSCEFSKWLLGVKLRRTGTPRHSRSTSNTGNDYRQATQPVSAIGGHQPVDSGGAENEL